jgi:hypothetical protein
MRRKYPGGGVCAPINRYPDWVVFASYPDYIAYARALTTLRIQRRILGRKFDHDTPSIYLILENERIAHYWL